MPPFFILWRKKISGFYQMGLHPDYRKDPYGQYILGKPANGLGNRAIYQPAAS